MPKNLLETYRQILSELTPPPAMVKAAQAAAKTRMDNSTARMGGNPTGQPSSQPKPVMTAPQARMGGNPTGAPVTSVTRTPAPMGASKPGIENRQRIAAGSSPTMQGGPARPAPSKTPQQTSAQIRSDAAAVGSATDSNKSYSTINQLRNSRYGSNPTPRTVKTGEQPRNTGGDGASPVVGSTTVAPRGPQTQALSNTERRKASGDVAPARQELDKSKLSTAAIQTINRGRQIVQDRAKKSVGAPAGGNYASAVKKKPSIAAREPDEKTGSTGGRAGLFGIAQKRRDNMADAMNTKTRIGIARKSGNETSLKGNDAWQNRITKPEVQRDANYPAQAAQRKASDARMTDRLKAREPVERKVAPEVKSNAGSAQAATPAAAAAAPKAKEQSWSQKVGQAMRDHVKKGGKAGDTITVDGKKIKVSWKDKAYQKRLTQKYVKETLDENRVVKKTKKSMLAHPAAQNGPAQQSMNKGRRYRIRVKPLAEENGKKKMKVVVNFEPENNNPIQ